MRDLQKFKRSFRTKDRNLCSSRNSTLNVTFFKTVYDKIIIQGHPTKKFYHRYRNAVFTLYVSFCAIERLIFKR